MRWLVVVLPLVPVIPIILKGDVLGSLEAILNKLEQLRAPEVAVKIVSKGLGNVNESDILQAEASGAIVYGFNVVVSLPVQDLAREKNVEIQNYKIIRKKFILKLYN